MVLHCKTFPYYHDHQGMLTAQILLTLSPSVPVSYHSGQVFLAVSSMLDFAGQPTLVCLYVGVRRKTSLMSLSLLLQQCPPCLVHLR